MNKEEICDKIGKSMFFEKNKKEELIDHFELLSQKHIDFITNVITYEQDTITKYLVQLKNKPEISPADIKIGIYKTLKQNIKANEELEKQNNDLDDILYKLNF